MEREQEQEQRLYLILDDHHPYRYYSIREINLSPPSPHQQTQTRSSSSRKKKTTKKKNTAAASSGSGGGVRVPCLPQPIVRLEAQRGLPNKLFAAVGTKILFTQCLDDDDDSNYSFNSLPLSCSRAGDKRTRTADIRHYNDVPSMTMPVFDVRDRCATLRPSNNAIPCHTLMYLPVGHELFALDTKSFSKLVNPDDVQWSWHRLLRPPLDLPDVDLTSYAVDADGHTIVLTADSVLNTTVPATVAFDTRASVWEIRGDWALPFAGRAFFVRCLGAFVGLSKDPATSGHLVSCEPAVTGPGVWKLGKEKLFGDEAGENHVSATLVYTGSGGDGGSEFCLVQYVYVSVEHGNGGDGDEKNCWGGYRYRLTTFSVSYDSNGDLTTGNTSRVQYYEVPRETTQEFIDAGNPVAFWL